MSNLFNKVKQELKDNREARLAGKDLVIPWVNFPKLSTALPGIQRGRYYMITSGPKAGKTQLTDALFVFEPLNYIAEKADTNLRVEIFIFSLEMKAEDKITQLVSNRIFQKSGRIIPPEELRSLYQHYILDQETVDIIDSPELEEEFKFIESHINYIDYLHSPIEIMNHMWKVAIRDGKFFLRGKEVTFEPDSDYQAPGKKWDSYEPFNKDKFTIVITDHVGLLDGDDTLDNLIKQHSSSHARIMRDKFMFTPVDVQQQSLGVEGASHTSNGGVIISKSKPSASTLGDNRKTARNIDVMFGIFAPYKYEIEQYPQTNGFDLLKWKDNYRELTIIMNRRSRGAQSLHLYFDGRINHFEELPPPIDFINNPKLIEKWIPKK